MNQTPTGGSPAPSSDAGEPDPAAPDGAEVVEPPASTAAAGRDADIEGTDGGDATGPGDVADEDAAAAPRVPAPRAELDPLPRRTRSGDRPETRRRSPADETTLHRLLTKLRDI